MKMKDEVQWKVYVDSNAKDPYGARCVSYAQDWANFMERLAKEDIDKLTDGAFMDLAEATAKACDTDGITGFMYGAAVQMLSECWFYGERLRRWHNKEEGAPNAEGVINPAILNLR